MPAAIQFLMRLLTAVSVAAGAVMVADYTQGQRGPRFEGPGTRDLPFNADQFFVPRWRLTNGPQVRAAFRDVVEPVVPSTVRIVCEDKDVAYGAIIRADGWILTKYSLLKGDVSCRLSDERESPATIAAFDKQFDLALLRVDATNLTPLRFAPGLSPVGSWAATVGLWYEPVAVGIISVLPRSLPHQKGYLGVELDRSDAPLVSGIRRGSGAEEAGVKEGDLITKVNGQPVGNRFELINRVNSFSPGDEVELEVMRDGESLTLSALLKSDSALFSFGGRGDTAAMTGGPLSERRFGFPRALQHDTVLRPNECGGPLVNLHGECIGLNIARSGRTESFAIDAPTVQEVAARLLTQAGASPSVNSPSAVPVTTPAGQPATR